VCNLTTADKPLSIAIMPSCWGVTKDGWAPAQYLYDTSAVLVAVFCLACTVLLPLSTFLCGQSVFFPCAACCVMQLAAQIPPAS